MYEPRSFVGCSIYEEKSEAPIDEIYLRANLPYLDAKGREEAGKNLASLVLEKTPFLDGDKIETIRKEKLPVSRSVGESLGLNINYTVHRYNSGDYHFEKGFVTQMQASKK